MNRTAILRERRSVSIAEAALRDPSTTEILRDAGLPAPHSLVPAAARKETRASREVLPDSCSDSGQLCFDDLSDSLRDGSDKSSVSGP